MAIRKEAKKKVSMYDFKITGCAINYADPPWAPPASQISKKIKSVLKSELHGVKINIKKRSA